MKKIILFLFSFLLSEASAFSDSCFLVKEKNQILQSEGNCKTPYPPQSTFKIPLSLMGFDSGIFVNDMNPSWSLPKGTDPYISVCKGDHNPRTWIRDSCLWYSRILTKKLGMKKFQDYVTKFDYGNKDLSGDKGQNNGLTQAWISSSLKILPEEQIVFLQKLIDQKFPITKVSYVKTKNILFIQEMAGSWKLYGKSGNGLLKDKDGNKTDLQHGWFVGWIEKGSRKIVFASHIADNKKSEIFASLRAKNEALNKLWYLINEMEK